MDIKSYVSYVFTDRTGLLHNKYLVEYSINFLDKIRYKTLQQSGRNFKNESFSNSSTVIFLLNLYSDFYKDIH